MSESHWYECREGVRVSEWAAKLLDNPAVPGIQEDAAAESVGAGEDEGGRELVRVPGLGAGGHMQRVHAVHGRNQGGERDREGRVGVAAADREEEGREAGGPEEEEGGVVPERGHRAGHRRHEFHLPLRLDLRQREEAEGQERHRGLEGVHPGVGSPHRELATPPAVPGVGN